MLSLSRKIGESITIGQGIKVVVLGVKGGKVILGIAAPAEVKIERPEMRKGKAA